MKQKVAPFSLTIGPPAADGAYRLRAAFEETEAHAELTLPAVVLSLGAQLARPGATAPLGDTIFLGRTLGRALFPPPIRTLLLESVKSARGRRIQIQLLIQPAELAALPWELATIGLSKPWSPALRDDYAFVRLSRRTRPAPPARLAGPLCVLAAAAPGEDQALVALEAVLGPAMRDGRVELRVLHDANAATLERELMRGPVHILHIAAPVAVLERGSPRLLLRRGLDAGDLADVLAAAPDLRLVTLAGPQGDGDTANLGQSTLASALLGADLPATIAFAGAVPVRSAARFAAACYAELADGAPVDLAVTAGRAALAKGSAEDWGLVQLRLAAGGEQLFATYSRPRRTPAMPAGLPRILALAAVAIGLIGVLFFAIRMFDVRANATTPPPTLPTAFVVTPSPTSQADAPREGFWQTLFGLQAPPPAATPAPTALPIPQSYATYLTGANDALDSIAARLGSDANALASLNRLDANVPLRAERPLVVPVYRQGEPGTNGLLIDHGNPANPNVALTFDIEIDDTTLYGILDILRARGLHGTFFVTGHWVQSYPDAARAIVREGHEIANHSLTHPYFTRIGLDGAASELRETERIVQETVGVTTRPYFRFPYGDSNPAVLAVIGGEGYVAYHWSADDAAISSWLDRMAPNPSAGNGGILLMHGRQSTVAALPGWLDRLAEMGLHGTTLGETLK